MRMRPGLVLLSLLLLGPAAAEAQLCRGTAPFSTGPVRIGAGMQFTEGAKMFNANLAFGASKGLFGGVTVGQASYDDLDEKAKAYGAHVGYEAAIGTTGKAGMCPFASIDLNDGPDLDFFGSTAELSGRQIALGISFGGIAGASPSLQVVPFGSLAYAQGRAEITFNGTTETSTQDAGILILGVGFVVNTTVTVQPTLMRAFGIEDSDPVYGVGVTLNLGRKK
jgi:hypothetical protein